MPTDHDYRRLVSTVERYLSPATARALVARSLKEHGITRGEYVQSSHLPDMMIGLRRGVRLFADGDVWDRADRELSELVSPALTTTETQPSARISVAAGQGQKLLDLLALFFSRRTVDRVFGQVVLDMREEHAEELRLGKPLHARMVLIRGHLALAREVESQLRISLGAFGIRILRWLISLWPWA